MTIVIGWALFLLHVVDGLDCSCLLERTINNQGLHRDLVTGLFVDCEPEVENRLLLIEHLPSGAYADPFQLKSYYQNTNTSVYVDNEVDIEKPEHHSAPHSVHIYTVLKDARDSKRHLSADVTLPLHLRYHKSGHHSPVVRIKAPQVLVRSEENIELEDAGPSSLTSSVYLPCTADNREKKCQWTEITCSSVRL